MFGPDDMSVVEWLTMTQWEVELSSYRADAGGVPARGVYRGPAPLNGKLTVCEELAWSLIEQAAREIERQQWHRVTFAD